MCGRYAITTPVGALAALFGFSDRINLEPRWNVAPTQTIPVVTADDAGRRLRRVRFGLLASFLRHRPVGPPVINARSETAWDKPMFRASLRQRRCLIPADGFYEWQGQGGDKQPYFIRARTGAPIAMAGLWDVWRDPAAPQDPAIESAAILTCPANDVLRPLHDRMPVILAPKDWSVWLDPHSPREVLEALCAPAPAGLLDAYPVSRRVGSVRNDDCALIAPLTPTQSGPAGRLL